MDGSAHKLLESATFKTIHAHGFSRSSSQASLVMTDLMSRYLTLLSSTCAKYAQHAGRTGLTPRDAISALEEMGVSTEELGEYCSSEGTELRRYAVRSARRVDDINEFKAHLADGLKQDHDDAIPLIYAPMANALESEESDNDGDEEENDVTVILNGGDIVMDDGMGVEEVPDETVSSEYKEPPDLRPPPLPLSPISNPSSPTRKRQRTSGWRPPSHIPDFLPPFPSDRDSSIPPVSPHSPHIPPSQPPLVKFEKPPSPLPQPQALTSVSASDYMTPVPYSQSSLAAMPEWHLPSSVPPSAPFQLQTRPSRMPTPQTQPALIAAYHHILTHPPPANPSPANPSRHKVAMALLNQTQSNPRWDPPDTLYSSISPCAPRVAVIGPSYPVPDTGLMLPPDGRGSKDDDKERDRKSILPPAPPRSISAGERLTQLISQQPSRIPELARQVLSGPVYHRTTRLGHPPVLQRGSDKLTYGPGVPAPWNSGNAPAPSSTPIAGNASVPNGQPNGKGKEIALPKALPDAHMYATWDYEQKRYSEPLVVGRRGRMGSVHGSTVGVTVSLGMAGRGRSESKAG